MAKIGQMNKLEVIKRVDFGLYLDAGDLGEILLPKNTAPRDARPGSTVEVFIYHDSEGRLVSTTNKPLGMVGDFVKLKVKEASDYGVFLDWGLMKDLLVPTMEQHFPLQVGMSYLVYITLDKKDRIFATTKFDKYIDGTPAYIEEGEEIEVIIAQETDLGFKAVINGDSWGMLYNNEIFQKIQIGDKLKVYVKKIREDGKVDLTLQKPGYEKVTDLTDIILKKLNENKGFLPLNDKSKPEKISKYFGVSKKTFKKAVGALYKQKKIELSEFGIKLVD
jgi:predicted RNA-binding protein (virulence factor B family)